MLQGFASDGLEAAGTRRDVLKSCALVAGASLIGASSARAAAREDDDYDRALHILQRDPAFRRSGFSNHAPMVLDALVGLGHGGLVLAHARKYEGAETALPPAVTAIDPERWREQLGAAARTGRWEDQVARWCDWRAFFAREIEAPRDWRAALDLWAGRLAPGLASIATHGVIRTAHAARALARKDTPERRFELASGLAYWASGYEELVDAAPATAPRAQPLPQALAALPLRRAQHGDPPRGNIVIGLRSLREFEPFRAVRGSWAPGEDVAAALSDLTAAFARRYLRSGTQHDTIAFVHAVTGPCALRKLLPFLKPETARAALPWAWETAAAVACVYASPTDDGQVVETKLAPAELAARAVASGDDHAIKLTEVCLAEHALRPDPVFLSAAADVVERL